MLRQEGLAGPVCETAWKAQTRLCGRYRKLSRLGKPANVVTQLGYSPGNLDMIIYFNLQDA